MTDTPSISLTEVLLPPGKVASFNNAQSKIQLDSNNMPGQYNSQMTIELWVNPTSNENSDVIFSYGTGSTFLQVSNPNNLTVSFGSATLSSGVSLGTQQWRHIALVITPSITSSMSSGFLSVTLLVDGIVGILAQNGLDTDDGPSTGETLYLGSTGAAGATALQGLYSELRVWSTPLPVGLLQTQMLWRIRAGAGGPNLEWTLTSAPSDTTSNEVTYVNNNISFRTDTLITTWTVTQGTTYNLSVYANDYSWSRFYTNLSVGTQAVTGFWFGHGVTASLEAVPASGSSTTTTASAQLFPLAQPRVRLETDDVTKLTVTCELPPIKRTI